MSHVLSVDDFTSPDIKPKVTDAYLSRCDRQYNWLLRYWSISQDDKPVDPDTGVDVLSPEVMEYLINWTSYVICKDRVSVSLRETQNGAIDEDPYSKMMDVYQAEYENWFAVITREGILNDFPGSHNSAVINRS
jgi:hypothetical protein